MRKFFLNPEQLRVESFATDTPPVGRGTVAAHAPTVMGCQTDPPGCDTVMRAESCFSSCTDVDICTVV